MTPKEQISPKTPWYSGKEKSIEPNAPQSRAEIVSFMEDLDAKLKESGDDLARARLEEQYRYYTGEDKVVSSLEIADAMKKRPPVPTIKTGLSKLDDILGGFVNKQLIVIAAPTKNGKTSFCIELTIRLKDKSPLWLPFEEPAEELIQKFLDRGEEPPLFYTPEKITGNTLAWVEKKIVESKVKYNSSVVFIDHLHFIVPFSSERQDLLIGQTMRELKRLAKEWNVLIFLVSHLKKTRMDLNPDLEDLRDSSFTAQEADTVIMLWRKTRREAGEVIITDETNISVQANRRTGKTGNVLMRFDKGRFYEIDRNKEADEELTHWIEDGKGNKNQRPRASFADD